MKTELLIYRILSVLLLPVAALLAINCLAAILLALTTPPVLIILFLFACIVIYIIASYIFLTRGIDRNSPRKPVLRDWIRINGSITLVFFLLTIVSFVLLKSHPELLDKSLQQWSGSAMLPAGASAEDVRKSLSATGNFYMGLSVAIVVHVFITFHLMRRFRYLFSEVDVSED